MRVGMLIIPAIFTFATTASAETQPPDFSKGLEMLAQLALPEMKGAIWVKHTHKSLESFTQSYEFREIDASLSGNTWKLSKDNSSYLDFGSNSIIEGSEKSPDQENKPSGDSSLLGKMLRNYQKDNPEAEKPEKQEPASLAAKDARKLATALSKASAIEEIESDLQYGDAELPARILLFAAQLHAAGDAESANILSTAIFSAAPEDAVLIDKTISYLADAEYNSASNLFFESYDWKSYELDIQKLLEKYPRGWGNAPALAMLANNLEKRAPDPAKPSLPGITISTDALKLLDNLLDKNITSSSDEELARSHGYNLKHYTPSQRASVIRMLRSESSGFSYNDPSLWLLTDHEINENSSPLEKIKAMRMDGLIALAAVALDETLTPFPNSGNQSHYYYGDSNGSLAENIRIRYSNLNRPASRGEIATALLRSVIPDSGEDNYSSNAPDPASAQAAAIDFWKSHRDKSNIELAVIYIQQGSQTQQRLALEHLSSSKDPKAIPAYENAILNSDSPITYISSVSQYLTKRKKAAKPFADAYIKLVRENPPSETELNRSSVGWEIREAGGVDSYLKRLSVLVGDVSLSKLISSALEKSNEPADGENDGAPSPIAALATTIQTIPLEECMIAFGKVASKTTEKQWMEICQLIYRRTYYENRTSGSSPEKPSNPPSKEILDLWKPIIAKTDPLPESDSFANIVTAYGAKTTGDASAFILELSANTSLNSSLNDFGQLEGDGSSIMKFMRQRTDAYTSSETPEPWPGDVPVTDERRDEITQKLSQLPANEIIPFAKSLPRPERLALMKFVQGIGYRNEEGGYDGFSPAPTEEPAQPTPAPKGLLELRNTLVSLDPIFRNEHNPEIVPTLGIAIGDKINTALFSRLATHLLKNPEKSSGTTIAVYPAAISLGATIYTSQNKDLTPEHLTASYLPQIASVFEEITEHEALVVFFGQGIDDVLALKDGKLISVSTDDEETENKQTLDSFDKLLAENHATIPIIYMSVLTAKDAQKINNQEEEE